MGKLVIRVNEAYTSKTASWTGEVFEMGGREWIRYDGQVVNRDINGVRGIFLRALQGLAVEFEHGFAPAQAS